MTFSTCSDPVLRSLPPEPPLPGLPTWLDAPVVLNEHDRDRYWHLVLRAPAIAAAVRPGQFVMLTQAQADVQGPVLPRPMAVSHADAEAGTIVIRYAVVGRGTRLLTTARPGQTLVTVGPLGRPFDFAAEKRGRVLLLGRGIGICSLTLLGARAVAAGHQVMAVSSARTRGSVIGTEHYRRSGVLVREVNDDDGSSEIGELAASLRAEYGLTPPFLVAACGSRRLIALASQLGRDWGSDAQVSVEAPMACGLGYCHGCATGVPSTAAESPLVCSDGPVFRCS